MTALDLTSWPRVTRARSASRVPQPRQAPPPLPSTATVRIPRRTHGSPTWEICRDALAAAVAAAPHVPLRMMLVYPALWVIAVGAARGYESRLVPPGREDVRRVVRAALGIAVAGAALSATAAAPLLAAPGEGVAVVATAAALSLGHRGINRIWRQRVADSPTRVVVAGREKDVHRFLAEHDRASTRHLEVVGVCLPKGRRTHHDPTATVGLEQLPETALSLGAQGVIVLPCKAFTPWAIRRLGWRLGEASIELFLAPGLIDVDGQRTTVHHSGAVAMLHVRAPELRGTRRVIVDLTSRVVAVLLVLLLAPLLAAIAILVRVDTPGPVIYRQVRVGRNGSPFVMWKFRTMTRNADAHLPELYALNESDGPLFKIREDPRITPIGRWLRRFSLDELPQLLNVVRGDMTLVGPRPALPAEVASYDDDARRRLAVKPGVTGLWQVSGRSDLSWTDGTRLDLLYVDNWCFLLDLRILARTVRAVVRPTGAY